MMARLLAMASACWAGVVQRAAAVEGRKPQAAGLEHGLEVVGPPGELGDDGAEGLGAGVAEAADVVDGLDEIVAPGDLVAGTAEERPRDNLAMQARAKAPISAA